MNTNQATESQTTAKMPFAASILSSVFGKNTAASGGDSNGDAKSPANDLPAGSGNGDGGEDGNGGAVSQILRRLESKKEQVAVCTGRRRYLHR